MIKSGTFGDYCWIETQSYDLGKIFQSLEKEILGSIMVVATFDCGSISPSEEEKEMGWYSEKGALYAPKLRNISSIPWDNQDEIYFFDSSPEPVEYMRFVNIGAFSMVDPKEKLAAADPTWDMVGIERYGESEIERQAELKNQILKLGPKICVLNGDNLILIFRDGTVGKKIEAALGSA